MGINAERRIRTPVSTKLIGVLQSGPKLELIPQFCRNDLSRLATPASPHTKLRKSAFIKSLRKI